MKACCTSEALSNKHAVLQRARTAFSPRNLAEFPGCFRLGSVGTTRLRDRCRVISLGTGSAEE
eukprot:264518-Rhodomonas_salina.1